MEFLVNAYIYIYIYSTVSLEIINYKFNNILLNWEIEEYWRKLMLISERERKREGERRER